MSAEAKVGAFAIGGLAMLTAAGAAVGDFHFGSSDEMTLYAGFHQVIGLEEQSTVRLSGVPVGNVAEIENDGQGVTVTMKVKSDLQIPKKSTVTITGSGVMGEKFLNITPGNDNGVYLEDGDYLYGKDESDMNSMFDGMTKVLDKVQLLLEAVHSIIGNEAVKESVVAMSGNMKDASEHMSGLMASLERMSTGNEANVTRLVVQMDAILSSLNTSMANVEHMTTNLDNFAGDPRTVEDLRTTLANISETSKKIAHMADNMDKVAGDPKVANDLKDTISNAKNITERADKILGKVQGATDKVSSISVTPSVDVLYSGKKSNWDANLNLNLAMGGNTLDLGVEHLGDGSKLNAQVGKKFNDSFGARAGVVAGKLGVGVDAYAGDRWKFSAEAYDPNDARVRLKSQYRVADATYILGEWHDVNKKRDRAAYFGIKQEF